MPGGQAVENENNKEQILFVNEFEPVRSHYIQISRRQMFKTDAHAALLGIALAALLTATAVTNITGGRPPVDSGNRAAVVLTCLAALMLLAAWFVLPACYANAVERYQKKNGQTGVCLKTVFSENGIRVDSSVGENTQCFEYKEFDKVTETRELYLLKTGKRTMMVAKGGFLSGNEKDFRRFIERKCPDARIIWNRRFARRA